MTMTTAGTISRLAVLALFCGGAAQALDLAGDWQGTVKIGDKDSRIVLHVDPADGGWTGYLHSDRGNPMSRLPLSMEPVATAISLDRDTVTLRFDGMGLTGSFEGRIAADGNSISGKLITGVPRPLELRRATKETLWNLDTGTHRITYVEVEKGVKLQVLDWGGSGPPMILLTGMGGTAHLFDSFAPKLTAWRHVYGITRRGFPPSSMPAAGYSADRLGDDVLAVMAALKIDRPVLLGHSIGGEELSSIGTRFPEKVSGLIYLDAGFSYAYYDPAQGAYMIDLINLRKNLDALGTAKDVKPIIRELLADLPRVERDLQERLQDRTVVYQPPATGPQFPARDAIFEGEQKYTHIPVPNILALFAVPLDAPPNMTPAALSTLNANNAGKEAAVETFEKGVPQARIVRIPHTSHGLILDDAQTIEEIKQFLDTLKQRDKS